MGGHEDQGFLRTGGHHIGGIQVRSDQCQGRPYPSKALRPSGRRQGPQIHPSQCADGRMARRSGTDVLRYDESTVRKGCKDLKIDYLNERPSFVLFLASRGQDITKDPIEIYGSDPYIVGGHTQSGYWVDIDRMTTVPGTLRCRGNRRREIRTSLSAVALPKASWPLVARWRTWKT